MGYKFNPFTQKFDLIDDSKNFSILTVNSPEFIPQDQQMIVAESIRIDDSLSIAGQIILKAHVNSSPRENVTATEFFIVPAYSLSCLDQVKIQGIAKIRGSLKIGRTEIDRTPPFYISPIEQYRVEVNRQALIHGGLTVHGSLKIKGQVKFI